MKYIYSPRLYMFLTSLMPHPPVKAPDSSLRQAGYAAFDYYSDSNFFFYSCLSFAVESDVYGPVFVQEPDDVIYPLNSEDKKVLLNCEARGNPPPLLR